MSPMLDWLLVYAFRSTAPHDILNFRRLMQIDGALGSVTAASFLLYHPPAEDKMSVRRFLFQTVPRLLPQLNRATQTEREVLQGRTHGRIDWSGTYKTRYIADGNPALFVCQQSGRDFDRPENQLLQFLLHRLQTCLERVPFSLKAWSAWGPGVNVQETRRPLNLGDELDTFAYRLQRFSQNVYLRDVTLPETIGGKHRFAARTAKNPLYTQIAEFYELYAEVVEVSKWETWAKVLNQTIPLPPGVSNVEEIVRLLS